MNIPRSLLRLKWWVTNWVQRQKFEFPASIVGPTLRSVASGCQAVWLCEKATGRIWVPDPSKKKQKVPICLVHKLEFLRDLLRRQDSTENSKRKLRTITVDDVEVPTKLQHPVNLCGGDS